LKQTGGMLATAAYLRNRLRQLPSSGRCPDDTSKRSSKSLEKVPRHSLLTPTVTKVTLEILSCTPQAVQAICSTDFRTAHLTYEGWIRGETWPCVFPASSTSDFTIGAGTNAAPFGRSHQGLRLASLFPFTRQSLTYDDLVAHQHYSVDPAIPQMAAKWIVQTMQPWQAVRPD